MKGYQEFAALPAGLLLEKSPANGKSPKELGAYVYYGGAEAPAIGARVKVGFNNLGHGAVAGYFAEDGYVGVLVKADQPPEWWLKQNAGKPWIYHCFGPEIELI